MSFMNSMLRAPRTPNTSMEFIKPAPVLSIHELHVPRTPYYFLELISHWEIRQNHELHELQFPPLRGKEPWSSSPTGSYPGWPKITFLQMDGWLSAIGCGANDTAKWIVKRHGHFDPIPSQWLLRQVVLGRWALASSALAGSARGLERIGQGDGDGRSRAYLGALGLVDPMLYVVLATIHYQQSFCVLTKPSCLAGNNGRGSHKASRSGAACLPDHCPSRRKITAHASSLAHSRSPLTSLVRSDPQQAADPLSKGQRENARGSRGKATSRRFSPAISNLIPHCHPHCGAKPEAYQATNARNPNPKQIGRPMRERMLLIPGVSVGGGPLFRFAVCLTGGTEVPVPKFSNIFSVSPTTTPNEKEELCQMTMHYLPSRKTTGGPKSEPSPGSRPPVMRYSDRHAAPSRKSGIAMQPRN